MLLEHSAPLVRAAKDLHNRNCASDCSIWIAREKRQDAAGKSYKLLGIIFMLSGQIWGVRMNLSILLAK